MSPIERLYERREELMQLIADADQRIEEFDEEIWSIEVERDNAKDEKEKFEEELEAIDAKSRDLLAAWNASVAPEALVSHG